MVQDLYTSTETQRQNSSQAPPKKQNNQTKGFLSGLFNKKNN